MSFYVVYDVTNNKKLGDYTLEELEEYEYEEYLDVECRDAYLIDGQYYVLWK